MPEKDVSIARYFADLPDPRIDRTKKHSLAHILAIALCAVVCGADSWEEVEGFGRAEEDWPKRFLSLRLVPLRGSAIYTVILPGPLCVSKVRLTAAAFAASG